MSLWGTDALSKYQGPPIVVRWVINTEKNWKKSKYIDKKEYKNKDWTEIEQKLNNKVNKSLQTEKRPKSRKWKNKERSAFLRRPQSLAQLPSRFWH